MATSYPATLGLDKDMQEHLGRALVFLSYIHIHHILSTGLFDCMLAVDRASRHMALHAAQPESVKSHGTLRSSVGGTPSPAELMMKASSGDGNHFS